MRQYEVVLILQPELEEAAVTGVLDRVKAWIAELGGSVVKVDNWGKRRMAYLIRKQREGQYYLVV
ncbi:MAG TPA: 30S ribosomal protein S6, partial [Anaerolineaceae bacterium]|nr:30S ribosomal protein S6 [Anaerolineaceae bacterium]